MYVYTLTVIHLTSLPLYAGRAAVAEADDHRMPTSVVSTSLYVQMVRMQHHSWGIPDTVLHVVMRCWGLSLTNAPRISHVY